MSTFSGWSVSSGSVSQGPNQRNIVIPADPQRMGLYLEVGTGNSGVFSSGILTQTIPPPQGLKPWTGLSLFSNNTPSALYFPYKYWGPVIQQDIWLTTGAGSANGNWSTWRIDCPFSQVLDPLCWHRKFGVRYFACLNDNATPAQMLLPANPQRAGFVVNALGSNQILRAMSPDRSFAFLGTTLDTRTAYVYGDCGEVIQAEIYSKNASNGASQTFVAEIYKL